MVKAAAVDAGLDLARVHVIPFPVNEPDLWPAYVPDGVTQYLRLFSVYHGQASVRFWIITEADRSATTVLLPEEY